MFIFNSIIVSFKKKQDWRGFSLQAVSNGYFYWIAAKLSKQVSVDEMAWGQCGPHFAHTPHKLRGHTKNLWHYVRPWKEPPGSIAIIGSQK